MRARTIARLLACFLLSTVFFVASKAHAVGSVRAEKTTIDEVDGTWKVVLNVDYGGVPDINYVPVLLIFTPTMLYERSLTDASGDKPVITKRPLSQQATINEQLEIGFTDGQGKAFRKTKFDFKIRRDRGFEAGEYDLEIKRSSDSKTIGTKFKLILNGDNPVVDRRAMVFAGEKKKDPAEKKDGEEKKDEPVKDESHVKADGELEPNPDEAPAAPPSEKPKQGGCGCHVIGETDGRAPYGVAAILAGAAILGSRARKRRSVAG